MLMPDLPLTVTKPMLGRCFRDQQRPLSLHACKLQKARMHVSTPFHLLNSGTRSSTTTLRVAKLLLINYIQTSMMPKGQATVPLASDLTIRRSHVSPDKLINRPDGDLVITVGDIFTYAVSPIPRGHCGKADGIGRQIWG